MISDLADSISDDEFTSSRVEYITDPKLEQVDDMAETETRLKHFFLTGRVMDAKQLYDDEDDDEYQPKNQTRRTASDDNSNEDGLSERALRVYREDFVLTRLRKHEEFAGRKFKVAKGLLTGACSQHSTWFPFTYLLCSGYSVRLLKAIYKMYPDALAYPIKIGLVKMYPIAYACQHRNHEIDLIRFMAWGCTAALTTTLEGGPLPIHTAIRARAKTATIQVLLKYAPESVGMKDHSQLPFPVDSLSLACQTKGTSQELITLLAQSYCKITPESFVCNQQVARRLNNLQLLKKILLCPLRRFTYVCKTQFEALPLFVRLMGPKWRSLNGEWTKWTDDTSAGHILEPLIRSNNSVECFSLFWEAPVNRSELEVDHRVVVVPGLSYNRKLDALSIRGMHCARSYGLGMLLTPTLKSLTLEDSKLPTEALVKVLSKTGAVQQMMLKEVRLAYINMPPNALLGLLSFASQLHFLELLVLRYNRNVTEMREGLSKDKLTKAVVSILSKGKLKKLELVGLKTDIGRICSALRGNKSLTCFCCSEIAPDHGQSFVDLLSKSNSVLARVIHFGSSNVLPFSPKEQYLVQYYTQLNFFGRGEAQDEKISMVPFVSLLSAPLQWNPATRVEEEDSSDEEEEDKNLLGGSEWHRDHLNLFNIHYCLLSQCPHLWSRMTPGHRKAGKTSGWKRHHDKMSSPPSVPEGARGSRRSFNL